MATPPFLGGGVSPPGMPPRLALTIPAPPGMLGLAFDYFFDTQQQNQRFVRIVNIDRRSPVYGPLCVGDLIVAVNGVAVTGKDVSFVDGILVGCQAMPRQISICRLSTMTWETQQQQQQQQQSTAMIPMIPYGDYQAPSFQPRPAGTQTSTKNARPLVADSLHQPQPRAAGSQIHPQQRTNARPLAAKSSTTNRTTGASSSTTTSTSTLNRNKENATPAAVNRKSSKPSGLGKKKPPPPQQSAMAPSATRKAILVPLPSSKTAPGLTIVEGTADTSHFVQVAQISANSPVVGKVMVGDWISHINGAACQNISGEDAMELFEKETTNHRRSMVVLRDPSNKNPPVQYPSASSASTAPAKQAGETKRAVKPKASKKPPPKSAMVDLTAEQTKRKSPEADAPPHSKKRLKSIKPARNRDGTMEQPAIWPERGCVDEHGTFYCTKTNETLAQIAEKLGASWKDMASDISHKKWYGGGRDLRSTTQFRADTLVCIPDKHSKWKVKQLHKQEFQECELETCLDCNQASNPEEILMCDGCDGTHHIGCVGLAEVPEGDWFCSDCLAVLQARKAHGDVERKPFELPKVPALSTVLTSAERNRIIALRGRLHNYLNRRRRQDLQEVADTSAAIKLSLQQLVPEIKAEVTRIDKQIANNDNSLEQAKRAAQDRYDLVSFSVHGSDRDFIGVRENGNATYLRRSEQRLANGSYTPEWNAARQRVRWYSNDIAGNVQQHNQTRDSLNRNRKDTVRNLEATRTELAGADDVMKEKDRQVRLRYAALLGEPRLLDETPSEFRSRPFPPRYMGQVMAADDDDVITLCLLREPDELILLVPLDTTDTDHEPRTGKLLAVFACASLFDKKRDDEMPMERNNVRDAQRDLFRLLAARGNSENKHMVVSLPSSPPSVRPRETDASHSKCFDLTELVRDCNVELDLPREPTPASMVKEGLKLRPYQEQSLRWLLDKEQETTGLGLAGEFWTRCRFLDPAVPEQSDFFYCQLTGSFCLDPFDFRVDVDQRDASANRFSMPTGGVLGEEMGLGKTVIAIALVLANPPPLHRRVLKREHLWSLEKKTVIDHDDYTPLPPWGPTEASVKTNRISNGTLVIVPQTLLGQWEAEISRFAPHLSYMVLHSAENPTLQGIASQDIIIASTYIFQQHRDARKNAGFLLGCIKKIHFHRLLCDESHNNQEEHSITRFTGMLSATHRLSLSGTPIGSSVSDLQGQMRLLRLAPFCRRSFFKNNISDPYHDDHSLESLRVLRALLSHVVCRHSKDQTQENGDAIVALPPRTVSTVLLDFANEHEKRFYDILETKNRMLLRKLKHESKATLHNNYNELQALLLASRQACCHASLVDLSKIDRHIRRVEARRDAADGGPFSRSKPNLKSAESKTRSGILKLAIERARPSAKQRMVDTVNQFQASGALLECMVCLEAVEETQIAIPACGHALCGDCVLSLLSTASATREATGHCPQCRDTIRRSEITFLGEAEDAGTFTSKPNLKTDKDTSMADDVQETRLASFKLKSCVTHASVTGASTSRADWNEVTEAVVAQKTTEQQALLPRLEEALVSSQVRAEPKVGSKIACLLREVDAMMKKSTESKCVIFSQYTRVLDIAAIELHARGIGFVRIDGSRSVSERADALLEFSSNANLKVMLLSMRTGAAGLTLTQADHCFILDVVQNPALEEQAIDRIHRIGQTRPVTVKRFVMKGSVEERLFSTRRALLVDRPIASTGVCAAASIEDDEANGDKKPAAKKGDPEKAATNTRIETLEKIVGTLEVTLA